MARSGSAYGLIEQIVSDLFTGLDVPQNLIDTFAVMFYGAINAAVLYVAAAEDAEAASADVETVIGSVLLGLRNIGGVADPSSEDLTSQS